MAIKEKREKTEGIISSSNSILSSSIKKKSRKERRFPAYPYYWKFQHLC